MLEILIRTILICVAVSLKDGYMLTQVYSMSAHCIIRVNEDTAMHQHAHTHEQPEDLLHSYHCRLNNHQLFSLSDVGVNNGLSNVISHLLYSLSSTVS